MTALIEAHQRGLYSFCKGIASTSDEPVALTERVQGGDLNRLKLSAVQGLMAHVEQDEARGSQITAMSPVSFNIRPLKSPMGHFSVLAHIRYSRRRR
jgi:hypothetical protein